MNSGSQASAARMTNPRKRIRSAENNCAPPLHLLIEETGRVDPRCIYVSSPNDAIVSVNANAPYTGQDIVLHVERTARPPVVQTLNLFSLDPDTHRDLVIASEVLDRHLDGVCLVVSQYGQVTVATEAKDDTPEALGRAMDFAVLAGCDVRRWLMGCLEHIELRGELMKMVRTFGRFVEDPERHFPSFADLEEIEERAQLVTC